LSVLVTGGGGFIGSYLARELVGKGQRAVAFDSSPDTSLIKDILGKVKFVRGDVSDLVDVMSVVKGEEVEDVYHTAALLVDACEEKPAKALKVNVEGTVNVLEAARLHGVRKVVFISTAGVFSPNLPTPVRDDAPKYPTSVYGATKVLCELYGLKYLRSYGVDFRGVRFPIVYGAERTRGASAWGSRMIEEPALGKPVQVPYRAEDASAWLYVKDAVRALMLAHDATDPKTRVYNIGGSSHTVREVAEAVKTVIPKARIQYGRETLGGNEAYDDSNARRELGWSQAYPLRKGVEDHIAEVRKRAGLKPIQTGRKA